MHVGARILSTIQRACVAFRWLASANNRPQPDDLQAYPMSPGVRRRRKRMQISSSRRFAISFYDGFAVDVIQSAKPQPQINQPLDQDAAAFAAFFRAGGVQR